MRDKPLEFEPGAVYPCMAEVVASLTLDMTEDAKSETARLVDDLLFKDTLPDQYNLTAGMWLVLKAAVEEVAIAQGRDLRLVLREYGQKVAGRIVGLHQHPSNGVE